MDMHELRYLLRLRGAEENQRWTARAPQGDYRASSDLERMLPIWNYGERHTQHMPHVVLFVPRRGPALSRSGLERSRNSVENQQLSME
jgi:hypothetical protein